MKLNKINLDGKKTLQKFQINFFQPRLTKNQLIMFYTKLMQTTKVDMQRLNNKMKLPDLRKRFMHKKELEMLDMLVEKLPYLLVVVQLMVLKVSQLIKKEN